MYPLNFTFFFPVTKIDIDPKSIEPTDGSMDALTIVEDRDDCETLVYADVEFSDPSSGSKDLKTSNSELKTSNNELKTSNNDLRTSNKELRTSFKDLKTSSKEFKTPNKDSVTPHTPRAIKRRKNKKSLKIIPSPVLVYVTVGNAPCILNRHNLVTSSASSSRNDTTFTSCSSNRVAPSTLQSSTLQSSTNKSTSSTLLSSTNKSLTLDSQKSTGSIASNPLPEGMQLRVFLCPVFYPSLPVKTDEFSSQGSDREYQTGISNDNNYENKSRKIKDNGE